MPFKFRWFSLILVLLCLPDMSWSEIIKAGSCSLDDVKAAYSAASPGDVVLIPSGSAIWKSQLLIDKSITLKGSGRESTTVVHGYTDSLIKIALASDVKVRITGIHFKQNTNNAGYTTIYILGKKDGSFPLTKVRIDNCLIEKGSRAIHAVGWVEGLIDNNQFINCNIAVNITGDNNQSWSRPIEAGTSHALFIEDNSFIINNDSDREPNELIYHQEGARTVIRHNTFDATSYTVGNALFIDSHGNQNFYMGDSHDFRGQPLIEVYENRMYAYKSYRMVYFRGGSILFYNNNMKTTTGSKPYIQVTEEEGWQSRFFHPLREEWSAQDQLMNCFFWNNVSNGTPVTDIALNSSKDSIFIVKGRDYFMHPPQSTGGRAVYIGRPGGEKTFISDGPNAYYPYVPYTYPHPLRVEASSEPPSSTKLKLIN